MLIHLIHRGMKIKEQDGFILYTTLVVLSISLFIVVGVLAIFNREVQVASETGDSAIAFLTAESGIERTLYAIEVDLPLLHCIGNRGREQCRHLSNDKIAQLQALSSCINTSEGCKFGEKNNPIPLSNDAYYYAVAKRSKKDKRHQPNEAKWCVEEVVGENKYCIRSVGIYNNSSRAIESVI